MNINLIKSSLPDLSVEWVLETTSTNEDLKREKGSIHKKLVISDYQSGGKGRQKNKWQSEPGKNLLVSFGFETTVTHYINWLPLLTGLAIQQIIYGLGVKSMIKWPNDVMVNGKKIAGVLVENSVQGTQCRLVIGFGLNVNQLTFSPHLQEMSTSLHAELKKEVSREELLIAIIQKVVLYLDQWQSGVFHTIKAHYRSQCETIGKRITFNLGEKQLEGDVLEVTDSGSIIIRTESGIQEFSGSDIQQIRKIT